MFFIVYIRAYNNETNLVVVYSKIRKTAIDYWNIQMIVLGIESSCDETAAAIVNDKKEILGESLLSQEEHKAYGGVVPEIAARSHLEHIDEIIESCIKKANIKLEEIDAIAAASGPGLIGGVVVGVMAAKALALALNKPFVAVNHLEGHALAARLTSKIEFPYLLLLTSGGHCQILVVKNVGEYERLGTTIDDAAGEAFDKVAKMLNLGYPGGPMIEKMASVGDCDRFVLPRPLHNSGDFNLSFSGLFHFLLRRHLGWCHLDVYLNYQKTLGLNQQNIGLPHIGLFELKFRNHACCLVLA